MLVRPFSIVSIYFVALVICSFVASNGQEVTKLKYSKRPVDLGNDYFKKQSPVDVLRQLHLLSKGNSERGMPNTIVLNPSDRTWLNARNTLELFSFVGDERPCLKAHNSLSSDWPEDKGLSTLDREAQRMIIGFIAGSGYPHIELEHTFINTKRELKKKYLETVALEVEARLSLNNSFDETNGNQDDKPAKISSMVVFNDNGLGGLVSSSGELLPLNSHELHEFKDIENEVRFVSYLKRFEDINEYYESLEKHPTLLESINLTSFQKERINDIRTRCQTEMAKRKDTNKVGRQLVRGKAMADFVQVLSPMQIEQLVKLRLSNGLPKVLLETAYGEIVDVSIAQRERIRKKSQKLANEVQEFLSKKRLEAANLVKDELTQEQVEKVKQLFGSSLLNGLANQNDLRSIMDQHDFSGTRNIQADELVPWSRE